MILCNGSLKIDQSLTWLYFYKNESRTLLRMFSPVYKTSLGRLFLSDTKTFVEYRRTIDLPHTKDEIFFLRNGVPSNSVTINMTRREKQTAQELTALHLNCYKNLREDLKVNS